MKTLSNIMLNQLTKKELEDRQMNVLRGGCVPSCCGCDGDNKTYSLNWSYNYENDCTTDD